MGIKKQQTKLTTLINNEVAYSNNQSTVLNFILNNDKELLKILKKINKHK